jgi:hypothetical protein
MVLESDAISRGVCQPPVSGLLHCPMPGILSLVQCPMLGFADYQRYRIRWKPPQRLEPTSRSSCTLLYWHDRCLPDHNHLCPVSNVTTYQKAVVWD